MGNIGESQVTDASITLARSSIWEAFIFEREVKQGFILSQTLLLIIIDLLLKKLSKEKVHVSQCTWSLCGHQRASWWYSYSRIEQDLPPSWSPFSHMLHPKDRIEVQPFKLWGGKNDRHQWLLWWNDLVSLGGHSQLYSVWEHGGVVISHPVTDNISKARRTLLTWEM